jgi:hypothetical protein
VPGQYKESPEYTVYLRSAIVDFQTQAIQIENLNATQIMNKILISFLRNDLQGEKVAAVAKMIDRLIELEPNLYGARKAKIGLMVMQIATGNSQNKELESELDRALVEAEQFDVVDSEIEETKIIRFYLVNKDKDAEDYIQKQLEKKANCAIDHYHQASLYWKQKQQALSKKHIDEAIRIEPNNVRFFQAAEKM